MKKSSLATILVLSTIGVTLFAQADSGNRGGFQELPNIEHKADKKHGERKKANIGSVVVSSNTMNSMESIRICTMAKAVLCLPKSRQKLLMLKHG